MQKPGTGWSKKREWHAQSPKGRASIIFSKMNRKASRESHQWYRQEETREQIA